MQKLYIFNPEHDLALANGNRYFDVPRSAKKLADDLDTLPLWYADENSQVFCRQQLPDCPLILTSHPTNCFDNTVSEIVPWGWDNVLCEKLTKAGCNNTLLPNDTQLAHFRQLAHRQFAAQAATFLREKLPFLPTPAESLTTLNAVKHFAGQHHEIVLKAPWSGSGNGLYWSKGQLTASLEGWCQHTIAKQGCVMGEMAYNTVQDFAMEFFCDGKTVRFAGFSWFQTSNGIYKSNLLASDSHIEFLLQQLIDANILESIKQNLMQFFAQTLIGYHGYLGVDMLIFRNSDDTFGINPMVEINLRMTMGMATRLIYDKYINHCVQGKFSINHATADGELLANDAELKKQYPLEICNNQICSGYFSLSPITENSRYQAQIII